jgi:serine protease inhibitor
MTIHGEDESLQVLELPYVGNKLSMGVKLTSREWMVIPIGYLLLLM